MTEYTREQERANVQLKAESERRRREAIRSSRFRDLYTRAAHIEHIAATYAPPSVPSAELSADENARSHAGEPLRRALAWEIERASEVLCKPIPLAASSLALMLLTSHDFVYGTDIETIADSLVSLGRIAAHIDALGFAIDPELSASIARRTLLLLLNASNDAAREPEIPAEQPKASVVFSEPIKAMVNDLPEGWDATPERDRAAVTVEKPKHNRKVVGYVRVDSSLDFVDATLRKGTVVELLEPTEGERNELESSASNGRKTGVYVWWNGKSRRLAANDVERVGAEDFNAQDQGGYEEDQDDEDL